MSWNLIRGVRASDLSTTEGMLFLTLASYPDGEGRIFAQIDTIAADTRLSNSGVRKTLASLVAKGVVIEVGRRRNNVGEYVIDEDGLRARARHSKPGTPLPRSEDQRPSTAFPPPEIERRPVAEPASTPLLGSEPLRYLVADQSPVLPVTPPPGSEPLRYLVADTPLPGSGPIQRNEPLKEPLSGTTPSQGLGADDEGGGVWSFAQHPDPDVAAFAAAVVASARWGPGHLPDRQGCENLVAACRRTIVAADRSPKGLGGVILGFGEFTRNERPRLQDAGPGYALSQFVANRLGKLPPAEKVPEPEIAPNLAEPPKPRPVGFVVSALGGGQVLPVFEGDSRAATAHPTRRSAEDELLRRQDVPEVFTTRDEDVDAKRVRILAQAEQVRRAAS